MDENSNFLNDCHEHHVESTESCRRPQANRDYIRDIFKQIEPTWLGS